MKRILIVLLAAGICGGCAQSYKITLRDGGVVSSRGKPKQTPGGFVYTDALGNKQYLPQGDVREIAPSSWNNKDNDKTIPYRN